MAAVLGLLGGRTRFLGARAATVLGLAVSPSAAWADGVAEVTWLVTRVLVRGIGAMDAVRLVGIFFKAVSAASLESAARLRLLLATDASAGVD